MLDEQSADRSQHSTTSGVTSAAKNHIDQSHVLPKAARIQWWLHGEDTKVQPFWPTAEQLWWCLRLVRHSSESHFFLCLPWGCSLMNILDPYSISLSVSFQRAQITDLGARKLICNLFVMSAMTRITIAVEEERYSLSLKPSSNVLVLRVTSKGRLESCGRKNTRKSQWFNHKVFIDISCIPGRIQ